MHVNYFSLCCDKVPEKIKLRKKELILVQDLRGNSPSWYTSETVARLYIVSRSESKER